MNAFQVFSSSHEELNVDCRSARVGSRLIHAGMLLGAIRPLLVLLVTALVGVVALVEPASAQILNGDASKPYRAIRAFVDVAMWATLGMGIFGLCWAGWNKTSGKAWGSQAVGGGICLGISGIIAAVNQLVSGNTPTLDSF